MTDEPSSADRVNDELFKDAVARLRESECYWRQQLEYALGHPVELTVDFDSLGGRYELVQPFIHRALSGALGAITSVGFAPATREPLGAAVRRVVISAEPAGWQCRAELADGTLTIRALLPQGAANSPEEIAAEIRAILIY